MRNDELQETLGLTLLAAGVAAAAGFIGTAHLVRTRRTLPVDVKVRRKVPHDATHETPHGRLIEKAQKSGKWWVQTPVAAAAAAALWRGGHRRAAAALSIASTSSALGAHLFDMAIFHRPPPPDHPNPNTPSFPSGHALQLAAVSLTAGYVVMRERIAPAAIAVPLALAVPLASSGARLYQDRHWASDVLGGWLAGIAIAAWSAATYEMVPEQRLVAVEKQVRRQARKVGRATARLAERTGDRVGMVAERSARGGAKAARATERVVSRTAERVADVARAPLRRRSPGVMEMVRLFAEDVLGR